MMMVAQRTLIRTVKNLYIPKINLLKLAWTKRSAGQELFIFPTSAYVTGKNPNLVLSGSCYFLSETNYGLFLLRRMRAEKVNFIMDALLTVVLCRGTCNIALCSLEKARREISAGNSKAMQSRI